MKRLLLSIVRFFFGERALNLDFSEAVRRCTIKLSAFLKTDSGKMFLSMMQERPRHIMVHNPRRPLAGYMVLSVEGDMLCRSAMIKTQLRHLNDRILATSMGWHNSQVTLDEICRHYLNVGFREEDFIAFLTRGLLEA